MLSLRERIKNLKDVKFPHDLLQLLHHFNKRSLILQNLWLYARASQEFNLQDLEPSWITWRDTPDFFQYKWNQTSAIIFIRIYQ